MAVISGDVGLVASIIDGVITELSGGSYAREALSLTGGATTGLSQSLSSIAAASAPAGAAIRYGMIFDASTNSNPLMYWEWAAPLTDVGTAFPATTINIQFNDDVAAAIVSGSDEQFGAGTELGNVNGAPLVAAMNLVVSGGNLIAEPATGPVLENPVFTVGGVNVGRFDSSGNFIIKGTLTASGTP